ncbi:MAG TPA: hypothetical protein PLF30_01990 [Candidatus Moranbacteria bacterium]|jgi:hypothetical protein|nr:hypothetical protein [Candidatus Moranbacteria bacterium]HOF42509.1 hypothetical protein [Candidatus Moranbacteria bacterium]HPX94306.1 hypothetical protein [Candidatus Moranbacteria bacterium]HQB59584.1 hypothetical protein [Candidatus Moranbacteria bacterium]
MDDYGEKNLIRLNEALEAVRAKGKISSDTVRCVMQKNIRKYLGAKGVKWDDEA